MADINTPEVVFDPTDVEQNKVMGILAYIIWLIPLLAAPNSPYAKYHTNQGLVLFLYWVALFIIGLIPILGWIISILGTILGIVLWVIGLINAINGKAKPLPIIGSIIILK